MRNVCQYCRICSVCGGRKSASSRGDCTHHRIVNSCPHTPDLRPSECGKCYSEEIKNQRDAVAALIPALEENRSTMAVARKLRSILEMPTKHESVGAVKTCSTCRYLNKETDDCVILGDSVTVDLHSLYGPGCDVTGIGVEVPQEFGCIKHEASNTERG